jgi:hypothetical protein
VPGNLSSPELKEFFSLRIACSTELGVAQVPLKVSVTLVIGIAWGIVLLSTEKMKLKYLFKMSALEILSKLTLPSVFTRGGTLLRDEVFLLTKL